MTTKYENFQNLGSEEIGKAPSPQSILCNTFSWTCLILFSLGLSLLLLVVVAVIGYQNSQLQRDLGTLRTTLDNLTSNTEVKFQALTSKGNSLQESIGSLKEEVEDNRQELQAGRSLKQKVESLESTVEKKEQALKTDQSEIFLHIQQLGKDLKSLNCQLANLKNNGSEMTCCPLHWTEYEGSCYWFSKSGKSWPEADKYCQLENAHLVVVNSMEEQKFIQLHKGPGHTWMGLTDQNGPWRWVDGTDFDTGFKNWKPYQPDNWHGHGLGGGEDCAHFHSDDGRWNDVCQKLYNWICETELGRGS
ncbi:C-type lectin domain family 10 member A-like [Nannospalax galili]|uniref:C-type lectin domain family 10 member A-like n=1 Tax=Nannospalax galili TaxID=1026970 RepID=UPI0004ED7007|nr:C-type lectin domain family 10 member A-like [Nannospalax galili]